MPLVISLGGSIVCPSTPDVPFITRFVQEIKDYLAQDDVRRVVLTIGGGALARSYIESYKTVVKDGLKEDFIESQADMIGIMATRLNAELIRGVFGNLCKSQVVYDPMQVKDFEGRVLLAAGWKPGFSTDTDAVILAENLGSKTVINLSNITKVYTADPNKDPNATPIDSISWHDFIKMVGTEWTAGKNLPFDPIASMRARDANIKVICANGRDIENLRNIFAKKSFIGTEIG